LKADLACLSPSAVVAVPRGEGVAQEDRGESAMMEAVSTSRDMVAEEPWSPLSIGVIFGGRTPAVVEGEIRRLRECVDRAIEGLASGADAGQAEVVVEFHVPGDVIAPDYEGMRTGNWIGKRRCQVIQVAVPAGLQDPRDLVEFLASNLEQAVTLAAERMRRFRRSSELSTAQAAIVAAAAASEIRSTTR